MSTIAAQKEVIIKALERITEYIKNPEVDARGIVNMTNDILELGMDRDGFRVHATTGNANTEINIEIWTYNPESNTVEQRAREVV